MEEKEKFDAFKYINNYQKENYDRITITRKKGDKDILKEVAKNKGFDNVTKFINATIDEKLKRLGIDIDEEREKRKQTDKEQA